jgi:hypothetical protein
VQQVTEVAQRFGWSANWTRDVARGALALVCLTAGKTLAQLGDGDFDAFGRALAEAPSAGHHSWVHKITQVSGHLHSRRGRRPGPGGGRRRSSRRWL